MTMMMMVMMMVAQDDDDDGDVEVHEFVILVGAVLRVITSDCGVMPSDLRAVSRNRISWWLCLDIPNSVLPFYDYL